MRATVLSGMSRGTLSVYSGARPSCTKLQTPSDQGIVISSGTKRSSATLCEKRICCSSARLDDAGIRTLIDGFQALTVALRAMEQPVIAAIEGYAVGGALEMAAACDLRVCDEETRFFCPEVGLGLLLSNGSSAVLPRLIG